MVSIDQIPSTDFDLVRKLYESNINQSKSRKFDDIQPFPNSLIGDSFSEQSNQWWDIGLRAISEGLVGIILLSGGQGSRLGCFVPKGMLDIGLPSKKSIFQRFSEYILKLESLAASKYGHTASIPFYILTSLSTTVPITQYFISHEYFGLKPQNVTIIEQPSIPCISLVTGEVLMSSKTEVVVSPNGNGGLFDALKNTPAFDDIEKRNIKYIHVFGVDNVLTRVADPSFLGYFISKNAPCGIKVIEKKLPDEKLGVICKVGDVNRLVEYFELPNELKGQRDNSGRLVYSSGNICSHLFTVEALKYGMKISHDLPYHSAIKKIPYMNSDGQSINPTVPNGIKFEKFMIDIVPHFKECVLYRVEAADEFAPVKNDDSVGIDCPETAKVMISNLHKRWLTKHCSLNILNKLALLEISPSMTYCGEGLEKFDNTSIDLTEDLYLDKYPEK